MESRPMLRLGAALVLLAFAPATARANPVPDTENPRLEESIPFVLSPSSTPEARRLAGEKLTHALSMSGLSLLRPGTLERIRRNMRMLEPFLIESQRTALHPDLELHREFRALASPYGRARMCSVLRGRIAYPEGLQRSRARTKAGGFPPMAELVFVVHFAEVLADYGDREGVPVIESVLDSLKETSSEVSDLGQEDFFEWYLTRAIERIEGRSDDPVRAVETCRKEQPVPEIRSSRAFAPDLAIMRVYLYDSESADHWTPIPLRFTRSRRLLDMEAKGPPRPPEPYAPAYQPGDRFRTGKTQPVPRPTPGLVTMMRMDLRGGVQAHLTALTDGTICYDDNSRLLFQERRSLNRALADSLRAISREFQGYRIKAKTTGTSS